MIRYRMHFRNPRLQDASKIPEVLLDRDASERGRSLLDLRKCVSVIFDGGRSLCVAAVDDEGQSADRARSRGLTANEPNSFPDLADVIK